jgi:hypothetical protein
MLISTTIPSLARRGMLATLLLLGATALRAASFEGRVEMKMTEFRGEDEESPQPHAVVYTIKGEKARLDFASNQKTSRGGGPTSAAIIMDFEKHEMIMLTEIPDREGGAPKKVFFRNSLSADEMTQSARKADNTAEIVRTGRKDNILGYTAEEFKITEKNGDVSEAWLAKGLGTFMFPKSQNPMAGRRGSEPPSAWEKLGKEGLFPLRAVSRTAAGKEKSRMEVTKIEKESVPDRVFTTEGYTEFQMPSFGSMMSGAAPGADKAQKSGGSLKDRFKGSLEKLKEMNR